MMTESKPNSQTVRLDFQDVANYLGRGLIAKSIEDSDDLKASEFAFLVEKKKFMTKNQHLETFNKATQGDESMEFQIFDETHEKIFSFTGRVAWASCSEGRFVSFTVRLDKKDLGKVPPKHRQTLLDEIKIQSAVLEQISPCPESDASISEHFIFTTATLSTTIRKLGKMNDEPQKGLLIVSAETNAGKTELSQAISLDYLRDLAARLGKWVNLVTFEDPIEKWNFEYSVDGKKIQKRLKDDPGEALRLGVFATLRNYSVNDGVKDVTSLSSALQLALRQTPSCFYIGEIRDDRDWKAALSFAGTGHFAVATCHAGSITETFQKVFSSVKAATPAERGLWASRVVSIVNLNKHQSNELLHGQPYQAIVPKLWFRTPQSISGLVADGLSSLIGNNESLFSCLQSSICLKKEARACRGTKTVLDNKNVLDSLDLWCAKKDLTEHF